MEIQYNEYENTEIGYALECFAHFGFELPTLHNPVAARTVAGHARTLAGHARNHSTLPVPYSHIPGKLQTQFC